MDEVTKAIFECSFDEASSSSSGNPAPRKKERIDIRTIGANDATADTLVPELMLMAANPYRNIQTVNVPTANRHRLPQAVDTWWRLLTAGALPSQRRPRV